MSENKGTIIPSLIDNTKLPEKLRTKATRLLLRLIAGTVGARVFQEAQDGIDTIKGRSLISMALAETLAGEAKTNPVMLEAARIRFFGEAYRKQENLQAVAMAMQEELQATHDVEADSETEVEDDWLNVFSRYAEDASSSRMQKLWGRVLAGQFRRPGSFSLQTLRLVAELDQQTAEAFNELAKYVIGDFVLKDDEWTQGPRFTLALGLEDSGLISGTHGFLHKIFVGHDVIEVLAAGRRIGLAGIGPSTARFELPVLAVSKVGRELLTLAEEGDERANLLKVAEKFKGSGFQRLWLGAKLPHADGSFGVTCAELIWEAG
jgi:hypothetical protein